MFEIVHCIEASLLTAWLFGWRLDRGDCKCRRFLDQGTPAHTIANQALDQLVRPARRARRCGWLGLGIVVAEAAWRGIVQ